MSIVVPTFIHKYWRILGSPVPDSLCRNQIIHSRLLPESLQTLTGNTTSSFCTPFLSASHAFSVSIATSFISLSDGASASLKPVLDSILFAYAL
nr:hypothetical protein Iba_chr14cCG13210 [Ipomoea batatas]